MNFQSNNTIIGFVYFGQPLLVPKDWYLAVDGDGTLNAFHQIPTWNPDDQFWNHSLTSAPMYLGKVDDFPLNFEDSLIRATVEEDVDPRLLQILAATGMPKQHKIDEEWYTKELETRTNRNQWDKFFRDFLPVIAASACNRWAWIWSRKCFKYLNLRIDMRDGGTLMHRDPSDGGERVLPELLSLQSRDPYFQGHVVVCYLYNSGEHKIILDSQNIHNEQRKQFKCLDQLTAFLHNHPLKRAKFRIVRGNMNRKHYRQFCKDLERSAKLNCTEYEISKEGK